MSRYKKIGIVVVIFALVYFSGMGSSIGQRFMPTGQIATKISYVNEPQTTISSNVLLYYAEILEKEKFRFDSGTTGKVTYFYGGKPTNINAITGLDANFGKWTNGVNSSGGAVFKPYGLDCSGFVAYVHWLAGYKDMPHHGQTSIGTEYVDPTDAVTGDLVFHFDDLGNINHVGILVVNELGQLYAFEMNAADNGVGYNQILTPIADGNYWEKVYNNPFVF